MMNFKNVFILFLSLTVTMTIQSQTDQVDLSKIDMQGHRGARGLMPENTIPAFLKAIDEGVNTLELDVVISKDGQVVVSHEAYMSAAICSKPDGSPVSSDEAKSLNLYQMTYEEISKYDCGLRGNSRFPDQKKMAAVKPLLEELIQKVESYLKDNNKPLVGYNIELKSSPSGDSIYHPGVDEFSKIVKQVLDQNLTVNRYTIQSFDFRILQYWFDQYPKVRLVALVENTKSIKDNIKSLGFKPDIYSPYYKLLNRKKIEDCHEMGMKVVPWTVNDSDDIKKLISEGVDGIITDYPNLISELKK